MHLKTDRLIIRDFDKKDATGLYEFLEHPPVHCFLSEKLDSLDEAEKEVERRCKNGYATEAAKALIDYLFNNDVRRIYAYDEDDNIPSQKLCERLGMRKEGLFIEFISFMNNPDGTPHYENTYQYAILKREWMKP